MHEVFGVEGVAGGASEDFYFNYHVINVTFIFLYDDFRLPRKTLLLEPVQKNWC